METPKELSPQDRFWSDTYVYPDREALMVDLTAILTDAYEIAKDSYEYNSLITTINNRFQELSQ